ncbi:MULTISPECIES: PAS domain-containing protein [Paenibacillus]|uniref:PAS domain-containing protein n=1 Tax=Paenibacillus TaxID=44249 RepID=UPI0022B89D45|nr:PAS domain-containing protein [Paenibacillus caseinilyticus]MCZ8522684.1 PAS domain-containing protein [Paenibacillus caseinilyticus]
MNVMDERLNQAPCGFLSLTDDNMILDINDTLSRWLGYDPRSLRGRPFHSILAVSSRIFYHIYFFPLIRLNGNVEEMYLSLLTKSDVEFPVLLNAVRREQHGMFVNECVFVPMRRRMEYEQKIFSAEGAAFKAQAELNRLQKALEAKQRELQELDAKIARLTAGDELA